MRKNSIVFDWFRKRKKNSILVLENLSWGQENYKGKGMIGSLLLRTYLDKSRFK
jgi:hypothetical protein